MRSENPEAILADGHAIYRRGMRDLLGEAGITVIGEADDFDSLRSLLRETEPGFVFVDASLADRSQLAELRHEMPENAKLAFLVDPTVSSGMLIALLELGAAGCLERSLSPIGFARSIDAMRRGEVALSRALTQRLCAGLQRLAERHHAALQAEKLTPREREVLRYVSQAARNRDIAEALSISEHTVKRHVQNILQKLELPTRVAAATYFERSPLEWSGEERRTADVRSAETDD
jgi:two-component system NarL family response regulator